MAGPPLQRPHLDPMAARLFPEPGPEPAEAQADSRARFDRVTTEEMVRFASEPDREIARALCEAPLHEAGQVIYSSNAVFLLELDADDPEAPDGRLRAIYKPRRGERPLWDFPRGSLHLREVAAYWLSARIGFGGIPVTVLRRGPHGPGSVQRFIHHRDHPLERDAAARIEEELPVLAAFDVLANNADRKRAHLLVSRDARLWGIDNALTFLPYPRQRTVLIDLGGEPLPQAVAGRLAEFAGNAAARSDLRTALEYLIAADQAAATDARISELAAEPWYPVLDDWDGRPFEWG